jgi:lipid A disaccharide synthetase
MQLVDGQSHTAIAAADAVLVASGTATLEVALFKKPMVIAYKVMRAEWQIMRHMGYQPWIGLPNILAREFLVPELLQNAATPQALADAVWKAAERRAAPRCGWRSASPTCTTACCATARGESAACRAAQVINKQHEKKKRQFLSRPAAPLPRSRPTTSSAASTRPGAGRWPARCSRPPSSSTRSARSRACAIRRS